MQRSGGVRSAPICYATFDGERQLTTSARELVTLMPKARASFGGVGTFWGVLVLRCVATPAALRAS